MEINFLIIFIFIFADTIAGDRKTPPGHFKTPPGHSRTPPGHSKGHGKEDLLSILGKSERDVITRTPGGTKRTLGQACTTPNGEPGACAYIGDEACSAIYNEIVSRGVNRQLLSYLRQAIRVPCGYDVSDYTLCCANAQTSTQPPVPEPTTPSPTTPAPEKAPCGFSEKTRIVGGSEARAGDWPWAVILGKPKDSSFQVICGGTLISSAYVLTASHCFVGVSSPATHVRVGDLDITTTADGATAEDIPIKKVTTHEGFTSTALQNDIAIIELETPVTFRVGVRPACLPDQFSGFDLTTLNSEPTIVGWGSTSTGGTTVTALREAKVPIVPPDTCRNDYTPFSRLQITENQICAGTGPVDTCAGDSGGPMLSDQFGRYAVIGITSFGVRCGDASFPGVYTRVDKFLDWIHSKTSE